jgi:hypothetical protein
MTVIKNMNRITATLHVHICAQRRGYNVTFATEDQAINFLSARTSTHTWWELGAEDHSDSTVPAGWTRLLAFLYPTCNHGMSLSSCYGPDHFMSADQEQAMGWDYRD